ncbi:meiosis induction protein kinase IME2/SME1 [Sporothrix brasiliensis 5110]|uniref:Meiosis induction protein kinase IME2/SME1 n=1 Tax=Sporothrix brasiliensis 5110 TaxID=1398154 RepID=A0A0C2EXT4_9PEZI|nr:meiosis induction protein kinase IME2/SME1 [Sporothrix brasiliensis 5110]KIH91479.1 meiosis induction protein kinase IME2/SME1 [Sporothrix brasiliensis 5110]
MALEERFEVLKEIGDGSFGSVVLARVRSAGSNVARRGTVIAIKTMKKTFQSFTPCLELREVVFLRTLPPHQHLVPALDIFLDPFSKKLHICMEYMEGNLYQLMKARDHKCLDNASVKSILFQIMQGLEHIHAHNFFHRDIKPENILVSSSGHQETSNSFRRYSSLVTPPSTPPSYTVKIADFGLARETHSKLPYTTYVSTRWYRAPEVLLRAGEYSAPVDIWAVGAMAVEVATLKPLFPGVNEVDQLWRVCEIMGSPGNWYNKAGQRVGGGEWREGSRLAGKLGFSFPKMAPHAIDTILQAPQWPASLSHFVTWCLMWDPKTRPTSTQALAHEYFVDAVDPLRPKSSASRILGRKQSDLGRASKDSGSSTPTSVKQPWYRKSLIGRSEPAPEATAGSKDPAGILAPLSTMVTSPTAASVAVPQAGPPPAQAPTPALVPSHAQLPTRAPVPSQAIATPAVVQVAPQVPAGPRPAPEQHQSAEAILPKVRPAASKRTTWTNGPSNVAPMPILPTIRPISPMSDAVTAQANNRTPMYNDAYANAAGRADEKTPKKIGRQLSVASSTNHYADLHRQQAEQALNGNTGLVSPPSAHKESFFSHLRKRARRFSGRHQTPISPAYDEMEAQAGCGPWASNRSSMVIDQQTQASYMPMAVPVQSTSALPTSNTYDSLEKQGHAGDANSGYLPTIPAHGSTSNLTTSATMGATVGVPPAGVTNLKRHHSLPHHQPRSVDNLLVAARSGGGPISSRTRRAQATQGVYQYDAPDEEDELLDEVLNSTHRAMKRLEKDGKPALRQSVSNIAISNPYPTPSPSASGHNVLFGDSNEAVTPKPLDLGKKAAGDYKWPTPPYDENDWAASASASIWAASNRF